MQLINKENDLTLGFSRLFHDALHALFKLAAVLGTSHQARQVQADDAAVLQGFGYVAGDDALRVVATCIAGERRQVDVVARYGGEEFVILARSTGKTEALRLGDRIRESISELTIPVADRSIKVTLSMGVAALPDVAPDGGPTELIALADARLYRAKAEGKNRVCAEGG